VDMRTQNPSLSSPELLLPLQLFASLEHPLDPKLSNHLYCKFMHVNNQCLQKFMSSSSPDQANCY
jgi:hypothetical protein